ncbi:MAG: hypothetical protein R3A46_04290 [Thermomicrobiales bacterium]
MEIIVIAAVTAIVLGIGYMLNQRAREVALPRHAPESKKARRREKRSRKKTKPPALLTSGP